MGKKQSKGTQKRKADKAPKQASVEFMDALLTAPASAKKAKEERPKAEAKPAKEAKRTIKAVVVEAFAKDPGATNEELTRAVKAEFPQSAFDAKHASWYRMQLKSGKLTGTKVAIPPKAKAAESAIPAVAGS